MEHVLKLTEGHLNVIGIALAELPFKVAQPVMAEIQAQVDAQRAKPVKASPPQRRA